MHWLREHRLLTIGMLIIGATVLIMSVWPVTWPASKQLHHATFIGLWVIDQPGHALYEATLYNFKASGVLETVETYTLGPKPADYVTGTVARPKTAHQVTCRFGKRWYSRDPQTLVISGVCIDDQEREITFRLQPTAAGVFHATIELVDGESGWEHRDFFWSWRRCTAREDCLPFR